MEMMTRLQDPKIRRALIIEAGGDYSDPNATETAPEVKSVQEILDAPELSLSKSLSLTFETERGDDDDEEFSASSITFSDEESVEELLTKFSSLDLSLTRIVNEEDEEDIENEDEDEVDAEVLAKVGSKSFLLASHITRYTNNKINQVLDPRSIEGMKVHERLHNDIQNARLFEKATALLKSASDKVDIAGAEAGIRAELDTIIKDRIGGWAKNEHTRQARVISELVGDVFDQRLPKDWVTNKSCQMTYQDAIKTLVQDYDFTKAVSEGRTIISKKLDVLLNEVAPPPPGQFLTADHITTYTNNRINRVVDIRDVEGMKVAARIHNDIIERKILEQAAILQRQASDTVEIADAEAQIREELDAIINLRIKGWEQNDSHMQKRAIADLVGNVFDQRLPQGWPTETSSHMTYPDANNRLVGDYASRPDITKSQARVN